MPYISMSLQLLCAAFTSDYGMPLPYNNLIFSYFDNLLLFIARKIYTCVGNIKMNNNPTHFNAFTNLAYCINTILRDSTILQLS